MAIVVEDGSGLSTAETYITIVDADAYHAARGNPSAWSGASTTTKESCLRAAACYLDAEYKWRGTRKREAQSLAWPRLYVVDDDNFAISSTVVPERVRRATAELALRHITTSIMPDSNTGGVVRERSKVGPLETEKEYAGTKSTRADFPIVDNLVKGLVVGGDLVVYV